MRSKFMALAGCLTLTGAPALAGGQAEPVAAPKLSVNDSWTYQDTVQNRVAGWRQTRTESTVTRAGTSAIGLSNKVVGSTMPPRDLLASADWSRSRNVDGHDTVVNRPFAFPLSIGKSWTVEYTETNPNRGHSSEHFRNVYKVVGWEDVTVPAGRFHAIKVESDGDWSAVIAPGMGAATGTRVDAQGSTTVVQTARTTSQTVSGHTYKAFWYAPEVKRSVKTLEEYYDGNNVRNESFMDELVAYKLAE